jgi:hypothetical protein
MGKAVLKRGGKILKILGELQRKNNENRSGSGVFS